MFKEFKEFAMRGNVIDLAVGVVIGASFTAIINSLVKDVLTPPIGWVTGGIDFSNFFFALKGGSFATLAEAQKNLGSSSSLLSALLQAAVHEIRLSPESSDAARIQERAASSFAEIARAERDAWNGRIAEHPFVIVTQPTLFDPSRAPAGRHVAWAYCHVPHAAGADMLSRIEAQIERFAPGFAERVLARSVMRPSDLERHNPNMVGGDIAAGVSDLRQLLARPTMRAYTTPVRHLYLCSASTPPGGGVHGMCGFFAAERALKAM
jgi:phytoene dehydrogenase-like protein